MFSKELLSYEVDNFSESLEESAMNMSE